MSNAYKTTGLSLTNPVNSSASKWKRGLVGWQAFLSTEINYLAVYLTNKYILFHVVSTAELCRKM